MAHSGTVATWNSRKGYGYVTCRDFEEDVFVHVSAFGSGELVEGKNVAFDVEEGKDGKTRASNVTGPGVDPNRRTRDDSDGRRGGFGDRSRDRDWGRDADFRGKGSDFRRRDNHDDRFGGPRGDRFARPSSRDRFRGGKGRYAERD